MSAWDELTPEQYAVMLTAHEEAFVIHVMDGWRARVRWAETGTTRTPSDLDDEAKRRLIPRFTEVITDLVARGWLEVIDHEHPEHPMSNGELEIALADPACW